VLRYVSNIGGREVAEPARPSTVFGWFPAIKSFAVRADILTRRKWPAEVVCALIAAFLIGTEIQSSWFESRLLAFTDTRLKYGVAPGPSHAIAYPKAGPYDRRLGYSLVPAFITRLEAAGYQVQAQARNSKPLLLAARLGLYPPYREKIQAGLRILDRRDELLYQSDYPSRVYPGFSSIPPIVVKTLSFIENRHLMDPRHPYRNPAIEWSRLVRAAVDFSLHQVDRRRPISGGSTLATQLEKMRHSPEGRTASPAEKLRQMASASLGAYREGPRTLSTGKTVICEYINSIPLAATASQGEVTGLGDGLAAWYGTDFNQTNRLLRQSESTLNDAAVRERARAYREVLSLFLALREPTRYLVKDHAALANQTDRYLHALASAGVISHRLRDFSLQQRVRVQPRLTSAPRTDFVANKAADAIRAHLLVMLGLKDTYALDRLDLSVNTTIDRRAQQSVTQILRDLADPQVLQKQGLQGDQLLARGDPRKVVYSFTIYERQSNANLLRVQVDNFDQPLDINQGTRLQLGSTAKLRTLINYLQIIEQLHSQYNGRSPSELQAVQVLPGDNLTRWAVGYLAAASDRSLRPMLQAALERKYSASSGEAFFTAGGLHSFANFESSESGQVLSVSEGFQNSVNLVFIRLMRDIEGYYMYRVPGASPDLLTDPDNPARRHYLERFADHEGNLFLSRFYEQYRGQNADQALETLVRGVHATPLRVAVIFRSVRPAAGLDAFSAFVKVHLPAGMLRDQDLSKLYEKYGPDQFNLSDRGYLAHVHPLELWLLNYREQHPAATLSEILAKSASQRQEVYWWLFRTSRQHAQDRRIRILLEEDAFHEIWKAWRQLGYPFDSLVPSYATSIGVSGDTPQALAELAGIIVNGGMRRPLVNIGRMDFGQDTPVETVVTRQAAADERVISNDIADLVRQEMIGVVQNGTGRRARNAFVLRDGTVLPVGGKTGTGDNRFKAFGHGGGLLSERVVNRTATFVFIIGDRFFGTVTAFVPGTGAAGYGFTSALAVQILKNLAPQLMPLITPRNSKTAVAMAVLLLANPQVESGSNRASERRSE
jgi:membrane peptidoglycan carboxypeptidase